MRPTHLLLAMAFTVCALAPAHANESAYTERNLDACKTLSQEEEGASISMQCAGYKDFAVYFKEGDLRQSQAYGPIGKAWLEEAFESFGPFNHTGAKIEWRLGKGDAPIATIVRWFVADPETTSDADARYGQVLVVSTVATSENPASCVVGYVDALENKNANGLARKVADEEAPGFTCGETEPQWHGQQGKRAGEPMRHLPETAQ